MYGSSSRSGIITLAVFIYRLYFCTESGLKRLQMTAYALLAVLFFVWPIGHTMSLREGASYLLLLLFGYLFFGLGDRRERLRAIKAPAILLSLLILWTIVAAIFISDHTFWSLKEIKSQWLKGAVAITMGALCGGVSKKGSIISIKSVIMLFFILIILQTLYFDLYYLFIYEKTDGVSKWVGVYASGPDKANYQAVYALTIILAELAYRAGRKGERFLPLNSYGIIACLVIILYSFSLDGVRNGLIVSSMLIVATFFYYLYHHRTNRKNIALVLIVFFGFVIFSVQHVRTNSKWDHFIETFVVAIDTETNKRWLDYNKYPPVYLADGKEVRYSNYLRVAWITEGLKLVKDRPLGVGFGREAFGIGLQDKYGEGSGHSHSGMIDMAVGAGIPGAILWILFVLSLIYIAQKIYRKNGSFAALLLIYISSGFFVRMFVDSTIRDHMLLQFLFFAGFLTVCAGMDRPGSEESL